MNKFNYYKINETFSHRYYQIPQELFLNPLYKDKLNSDSKLLYGFLLDRLYLSLRNNWCDEDNNVYLIFTRKEVQEKLCLSDKTVTKAFKQLTDCNLIYEKRQGANKPNLIYVGKMEYMNIQKIGSRKNYDSGHGKNTNQESENLRGIYTNNKNTNINNKSDKKSNSFIGRTYTDDVINSLYANSYV